MQNPIQNLFSQDRVYLDYAAGTPVCRAARVATARAQKFFANPSAQHTDALEAAAVLEDARARIAKELATKPSEIIFTSGGTEGNALALVGFFTALEQGGVALQECHAILSSIEHASAARALDALIARGLTVEYVDPDEHGTIRASAVAAKLRENTVLVSVGLVNNEIGTVQPLHAISALLKEHGAPVLSGAAVQLEKVVLHTDASQAMYVSLVPHGLGVDMMTLDARKMYGPGGSGALYVKRGTPLATPVGGGMQEGALRPGTPNVALNAGFAAAFTRATHTRTKEAARLALLRAHFIARLSEALPQAVVNGTAKRQSPHILNISIPETDTEYIASYLDARGVACSRKSACSEHAGDAIKESVVAKLGGDAWRAQNTLRFSFGRDTKKRHINRAVKLLAEAVALYRSFSA